MESRVPHKGQGEVVGGKKQKAEKTKQNNKGEESEGTKRTNE